MKHFKFLLIGLLAIFTISCNNSNDEATGVGDVLIVAKKSGANTVYALSFYAYTFSTFSSVKAVNQANPSESYTLKANQGFKTNFYFEPPDAEFTTTVPAFATYNFSAVFENGATDEFQDVLTDKHLAIPTISKVEFNSVNSSFDISWALLTDADSYAVNIFDGSTLIFASPQLSESSKSFSIRSDGSGWLAGHPPVNGKSYIVKLLAFLYESQPPNSYDIQATSIAQTNAVWGN